MTEPNTEYDKEKADKFFNADEFTTFCVDVLVAAIVASSIVVVFLSRVC